MKSTEIRVERFNVVSTKSFEETLAGLYVGIGRPAMSMLAPKLSAAESFSEFEQLVNGAVGTADLMEFLHLDLGMALRKDPAATACKMIRIIAGNPMIMKRMAEHVPDVGSYAPVTILIYESQDGIHLAYDTMASFLSPYGNAKALEIAKDLDSKVLKLISRAACSRRVEDEIHMFVKLLFDKTILDLVKKAGGWHHGLYLLVAGYDLTNECCSIPRRHTDAYMD